MVNETLIKDMRYVICGCGCPDCDDCNGRPKEELFVLIIQALWEIAYNTHSLNYLIRSDFPKLIELFQRNKELYGTCCKDNLYPLMRRILAEEYHALHAGATEDERPLFKMEEMEGCFLRVGQLIYINVINT